jgi:hypothetical protein
VPAAKANVDRQPKKETPPGREMPLEYILY